MKKKEKKKINIVLYTLLMALIFVFVTEGIIYGYGGRIVYDSITNYPQGNLVISEAVLAVLVLIVMLLFKNSYVFKTEKGTLKTGLFYGLFYIIGTVFFLLLNGIVIGGFQSGLTLINLAIGCLLVGICEEFLCRGWLLNEFLERYGNTKKGIWYSIIVSGIIFGLMHISNIFTMGQAVSLTVNQVISASAAGIMFGLIYYKTKNIWSVIIIHGLWDFSLFLGEALPPTSSIETISGFSVVGILFTILMVLAELLSVIPHIKDIDAKPKKGPVIGFAILGIILFLTFTILSGLSSTKFGETYEYSDLELKNYAVTRDNYEEYTINHTNSKENYLFKLTTNEKDNLLLTNKNNNTSIEIECESLYDYIIVEQENHYILAYIDYIHENPFLKYVYIYKEQLSNDSQYLNTITTGIKEYLLPMRGELLVINDYNNNKSYLSAYDVDYGYYVLVNDDEMSILNRG